MSDTVHFNPDDEVAQLLAAIVDSSDDAIIAKDLEGTIRTWNRGAERLYGYTAGEVLGRSISLLFPTSQRDELAGILERIRRGESIAAYETRRQRKSGDLVEVSLSVFPIRNATGRIVGSSAIARDITASKRAELALRTSEARWKSVVESAVDGVIVIDAQGRIEAFNPAAEQLFGYSEAEAIGRNVNELMPSPYHEEHDGYLARFLETGIRKIIGIGREVPGLRRNGETFPVHLSVGEMSVAGERKFTGILHDRSERLKIEEQLREQTALARLGEMAAVIAHEVKNPLAGIRGAIQVFGGRLAPASRDAAVVGEVLKRIDTLNDLIKDLLLFARPPRPHLTAVDVMNMLSVTADLLRQDPGFKNVLIKLAGSSPPILADAELLKIVFQNLMVNGAQAMQGDGQISTSVRVVDGTCQITIRDSGPGIPPEIREKIFTPFFTTKARGTGLGLPTAKGLLEAQGGSIHLESPPGEGAVVTLKLPVHAS